MHTGVSMEPFYEPYDGNENFEGYPQRPTISQLINFQHFSAE